MKNKWLTSILVVLSIPSFLLAEEKTTPSDVPKNSKPWYVDLTEATKVASSNGRPMMIVFR